MRTLIFSIQKSLTHLHDLHRAFGLIWSAARRWTIAWAALLVLNGLLPAATVYLSRPLVDSLVLAAGNHGDWQYLRPTLILVGLMVGLMLLSEAVQSVAEWVRTAQAELVHDHI